MSSKSLSFLLLATCCLCLMACTKSKPVANPDEPSNPGGGNPGDPTATNGEAFLYGSNMGYYPGWSDEQLSEILIGSSNSIGVGVNSLRPALYEHFVQQWGYDIRLNAFKFYQQLGAKDNVIFLNGPSDAHRDKSMYCGSHQSETFANLYEPIWNTDGQVNNNNYYASYVYNVVKNYGAFVKYWEVWNEPDYTYNWGASQTWAQNNPNPCDLNGFYAPIQSYVRMLRITYEIVKKLEPTDRVCLGGIGYEGFLDAILRNTDNPANGAVTAAYPEKGGAWFDCVSYHIYPMYSLGDNKKNSDAAAQVVSDHKNNLESVLVKYQYGGKKEYIVTECNIPRKALGGYIGSDEAQRNFMIKAAITSQKANLKGLYIYGPAESETLAAATDPYQAMGFYQKMGSSPFTVTVNNSGIAWRTVSKLLSKRYFDKAKTESMQLSSGVDGGAFYSADEKNYVYVLWAKTSGNSEIASASYSFPASFTVSTANSFNWDGTSGTVGRTVSLTGSPIFIKL